jgi:hypothetical protein
MAGTGEQLSGGPTLEDVRQQVLKVIATAAEDALATGSEERASGGRFGVSAEAAENLARAWSYMAVARDPRDGDRGINELLEKGSQILEKRGQ